MIYGYFGLPRVGKTYSACYWAWRQHIKYKRVVYSNIPLEGAYFLDVERLGREFYLQKHSIVLIDEVQWYANSRTWQDLSDGLYFLFSQGGKMAIDFVYTAQDSSRVDKTLREVTNVFYDIRRLGLVFINQVYYSNVDYSLQRKGHVELGVMRKWFWSKFDTSYWVTTSQFVQPEVPDKVWEYKDGKWDVVQLLEK